MIENYEIPRRLRYWTTKVLSEWIWSGRVGDPPKPFEFVQYYVPKFEINLPTITEPNELFEVEVYARLADYVFDYGGKW